MLILRLMAHCNNHCTFCLARDEMAHAEDIPLEVLEQRISQCSPEVPVDFFGGEPTLYPHFIEALRFARERGHSCSIASNGRRFSNKNFTKEVARLGVSQVRTSLYGHTPDLHDFHTNSPRSFDQTIQGISNIIAVGIDLYVNLVITSRNIEYLSEMVQVLINLGVKNIKFSSLTNAEVCLDLVPDFKIVGPKLRLAIEICRNHHVHFAVEKSPLCLLGDNYSACALEPDPYVYRHTQVCEPCQAKNFCVGIPKEQLDCYGDSFARPFLPPPYQESQFAQEVAPIEQNEFVYWTDGLLPSLTVLIKTSNSCNLSCDYCYAERNFRGSRNMSKEVIQKLFSDLSRSAYDRLDINWHGGEPLVMGKEFLRWGLDAQQQVNMANGRTVVNRLQTNGTLMDNATAEFLAGSVMETGISIDGPEDLHNLHRKYRVKEANGAEKNAFQATMEGISLLATHQVPLAALVVVTPESATQADRLYNFFREMKPLPTSVDFLPSFEVDPETQQVTRQTVPPGQYGDFMVQLFDRWFEEDDLELRIPFFEDVLSVLMGGVASLCYFRRGCKGFLTVHPNGDIFPCDRFAGLPEFLLGNINHEPLDEILKKEPYVGLRSSFDRIAPECWQCPWLRLCRGGCAYEAYATTGEFNQISYFCEGIKRIFSHIDEVLKTSVEGYQRFTVVD